MENENYSINNSINKEIVQLKKAITNCNGSCQTISDRIKCVEQENQDLKNTLHGLLSKVKELTELTQQSNKKEKLSGKNTTSARGKKPLKTSSETEGTDLENIKGTLFNQKADASK